MDLPSFLAGLVPVVGIGFVCLVAFRRRRRRGRASAGSPWILDPCTLAVEPDADAQGRLPVVQPNPPITTSQRL